MLCQIGLGASKASKGCVLHERTLLEISLLKLMVSGA